MIKKLLKNKLFIILILLVIIFIVIKIISTNQPPIDTSTSNQQSNQQISISPTTTYPHLSTSSSQNQTNDPNAPTPTIKITEINYQIPLYNLLPYQGKYFKVLRYHRANNLELIVFGKENTELAKQEAQEWLVKNGVDKLDTFTVIY